MGKETFRQSSYEPWEGFGEGEKYIEGVSRHIAELTKQYFTQFMRGERSREDVEERLFGEIKASLNMLLPSIKKEGGMPRPLGAFSGTRRGRRRGIPRLIRTTPGSSGAGSTG